MISPQKYFQIESKNNVEKISQSVEKIGEETVIILEDQPESSGNNY